jgi:hypothetical protein
VSPSKLSIDKEKNCSRNCHNFHFDFIPLIRNAYFFNAVVKLFGRLIQNFKLFTLKVHEIEKNKTELSEIKCVSYLYSDLTDVKQIKKI